MNTDVKRILDAVSGSTGRNIFVYDESFLLKSLGKRLTKNAIENMSAYLDFVTDNLAEGAEFFRSLNITYSEFFRDPLTFSLLEKTILPGLFQEKEKSCGTEIRIWCCGCSSGQEPYSVAILLDELAERIGVGCGFRVFATDSDESELELARRGMYQKAMIENVKFKHISNYFVQKGGYYLIDAKLRDRIDFSDYDILDELSSSPPSSVYGDFDIVICSNLMIYYREDIRDFILNKLHRSLAPNGFLITGDAEAAIVRRSDGFQAVAAPCAVFQRTDRRNQS
jgi:chemotaxis methyl-accepting protein methylase